MIVKKYKSIEGKTNCTVLNGWDWNLFRNSWTPLRLIHLPNVLTLQSIQVQVTFRLVLEHWLSLVRRHYIGTNDSGSIKHAASLVDILLGQWHRINSAVGRAFDEREVAGSKVDLHLVVRLEAIYCHGKMRNCVISLIASSKFCLRESRKNRNGFYTWANKISSF